MALSQQDKEELQDVIVKTVNGKIDKLTAKLDTHMQTHNEHWEVTRSHIEEMRPLLDALRFVQILQRFVNWTGLTLAASVGLIIYWFTKHQ